MRRIAILAALAAALALAAPAPPGLAQTRPAASLPASMSADDAYVRAVAYIETRFDALRVERAADAAAMAQMRAELAAAKRELTALKARGDAPSQAVVRSFAAGDPTAGLDAAEAAARSATGEARARWLQIAALAAPVEPQRAIAAYREALRISPADPEAGLALAGLLTRIGEPSAAADLAAPLARATDPGVRARALLALGDAARARGAGPQGVAWYREAFDAAAAARDAPRTLDALTRLAAASTADGAPPVWEGPLKDALAAPGLDPARAADAALALAAASVARGIWPPAATWANQALAFYQSAGDPVGEAGALMALGRSDAARPAPGLAEMRFRNALRLYEGAEAPLGQAEALGELAAALIALNRSPEACLNLRRAEGLYARAGAVNAIGASKVRAALSACR